MLMAKPKTKKSNKYRSQRLRRFRSLFVLLVLVLIVVAFGLYLQANRSKAAGSPFSSNVIMHIPGNNSNPALGSCSWSCFKPEITQVSVYIVPVACVSQSNQQVRDWCTDITGATQLTSCRTYNVQSGDQDIPSGTMDFAPYGPNAGQNVGQIHYTLYAAAGSSCGNTLVAAIGGTPQTPTKYMGVLPNCGTALGETCPIVGGPPSTPQDPVIPGSPGSGPSGLGPSGSGPTGSGPSGGSSGSTANKQSDQPNSLPSSSSQGEQNQQAVEPSPFFDGKEYAPGSSVGRDDIVKSGLARFTSWPYLLGAAVMISGIAAAFYWYRLRKK